MEDRKTEESESQEPALIFLTLNPFILRSFGSPCQISPFPDMYSRLSQCSLQS